MTQQKIASCGGYLFPDPPFFGSTPSSNTLAITATGDKVAFCGRAWFKERTGTKTIHKVHFRFGSVTKAGGSNLVLSLQDISAASNGCIPDETQDQTVTLSNASITGSSWYTTGALSADRTVAFGEMMAVVIEYDGTGRVGADTFNISLMDQTSTILQSLMQRKTGGSWSTQTMGLNVVLEFSDGSFGTIEGGLPFSTLTFSQAFNSGSSPNEYAQTFQFPYPVTVEGAWMVLLFASNAADCDVILYSGTTALVTTSIDATQVGSIVGRLAYVTFATPQSFAANTPFRLAVKATTVNNVTVHFRDLNDANHAQCWGGGIACVASTRAGAAWTDVATRQMFMGVRVSAGDDALFLRPHPSMNGGLNG